MEQCCKQGPKFIQDHKYITAVNEFIFTTLTITQQFLNSTFQLNSWESDKQFSRQIY